MPCCAARAWSASGAASSCCTCRRAASSARSAGAGSTQTSPPSPPVRTSADQVEDEVVLRPTCARLELHRAAHVGVGAGTAGDGDDAVVRVVERPLDGDLSVREERRPVALPGLADEPDAIALVAPDPRRVALV